MRVLLTGRSGQVGSEIVSPARRGIEAGAPGRDRLNVRGMRVSRPHGTLCGCPWLSTLPAIRRIWSRTSLWLIWEVPDLLTTACDRMGTYPVYFSTDLFVCGTRVEPWFGLAPPDWREALLVIGEELVR